VVKAAVVHHVDSLPLEELPLHIKKMFIHSFALAQLVDQPQVSLVLNAVLEHAYILLL